MKGSGPASTCPLNSCHVLTVGRGRGVRAAPGLSPASRDKGARQDGSKSPTLCPWPGLPSPDHLLSPVDWKGPDIPELLSTLPPRDVHLLCSLTRPPSTPPLSQCVSLAGRRFRIRGLRNEVCGGTGSWPQEGCVLRAGDGGSGAKRPGLRVSPLAWRPLPRQHLGET